MAQQTIDLGTSANDGTGDQLRPAFTKVNENFDEVYLAGPVGSNIQIAGDTLTSVDPAGLIVIASPAATGTANSGDINITTGTATGSAYKSGAINITGGLSEYDTTGLASYIGFDSVTLTGAPTATDGEAAGKVELIGGVSTAITQGRGGHVRSTGGASSGINGYAGDASNFGGTATGAYGTGGNAYVAGGAGQTANATGGKVLLQGGSATNTDYLTSGTGT